MEGGGKSGRGMMGEGKVRGWGAHGRKEGDKACRGTARRDSMGRKIRDEEGEKGR